MVALLLEWRVRALFRDTVGLRRRITKSHSNWLNIQPHNFLLLSIKEFLNTKHPHLSMIHGQFRKQPAHLNMWQVCELAKTIRITDPMLSPQLIVMRRNCFSDYSNF